MNENNGITPSATPLHELRWERVRLSFRNEVNRAAREHPLFIIRALLKPVLRHALGQSQTPWSWRPATFPPWGDRVKSGYTYGIHVLFGGASAKESASFFCRQLPHTELRNFVLAEIHQPETRSLADLENENPAPPYDRQEICLDFITPLAWKAHQGQSYRHLTGEQVVHLLENRLALFFGSVSGPVLDQLALEVRMHFAEPAKFVHASKSSAGTREFLAGLRGPVLLRGEWPLLWPLLLLAAELQMGRGTSVGQGFFRLCWNRTVFDRRLADPVLWQETVALAGDKDNIRNRKPGEAPMSLEQTQALARSMAHDEDFTLAPCRAAALPKKNLAPALRQIAVLGHRERLIHTALHHLLQPSLEGIFSSRSIGYRPGHSRDDAQPLVAQAVRDGYTHVAEADITAFFDEVDWDRISATLRHHLPEGDQRTLWLLEKCIRQPLVTDEGQPLVRQRGLLQGSPLSPLLANLFLHEWDQRMEEKGHRLIRFGDDFLLLAKSRVAADQALRDAATYLGDLGLSLNLEKTAIAEIGAGFRFLGLNFGPDSDIADQDDRTLKKTLYLTRPHTWASLDGGAIAVREGEALLIRVPLERVNHVVLLGSGGISTPLLGRCRELGVPVTFADAAGRYQGTLFADTRTTYDRLGRHDAHFRGLEPRERAVYGARIVAAKLSGYLAWLEQLPPAEARALERHLRQAAEQLDEAAYLPIASAEDLPGILDRLRGIEGLAARHTYRWVNDRAVQRLAWHSPCRQAHTRTDRWNLLVDTLSFLLFCRLNAWVRSRGLNPYHGLLHSQDARYEALVCDLQEPFRARLDRLALKIVNQNHFSPEHCQPAPDRLWRFTADGWKEVLQAFEDELDIQRTGDPGTLRQMLDWQVEAVRLWVEREGHELRLLARPIVPYHQGKRGVS